MPSNNPKAHRKCIKFPSRSLHRSPDSTLRSCRSSVTLAALRQYLFAETRATISWEDEQRVHFRWRPSTTLWSAKEISWSRAYSRCIQRVLLSLAAALRPTPCCVPARLLERLDSASGVELQLLPRGVWGWGVYLGQMSRASSLVQWQLARSLRQRLAFLQCCLRPNPSMSSKIGLPSKR